MDSLVPGGLITVGWTPHLQPDYWVCPVYISVICFICILVLPEGRITAVWHRANTEGHQGRTCTEQSHSSASVRLQPWHGSAAWGNLIMLAPMFCCIFSAVYKRLSCYWQRQQQYKNTFEHLLPRQRFFFSEFWRSLVLFLFRIKWISSWEFSTLKLQKKVTLSSP